MQQKAAAAKAASPSATEHTFRFLSHPRQRTAVADAATASVEQVAADGLGGGDGAGQRLVGSAANGDLERDAGHDCVLCASSAAHSRLGTSNRVGQAA